MPANQPRPGDVTPYQQTVAHGRTYIWVRQYCAPCRRVFRYKLRSGSVERDMCATCTREAENSAPAEAIAAALDERAT